MPAAAHFDTAESASAPADAAPARGVDASAPPPPANAIPVVDLAPLLAADADPAAVAAACSAIAAALISTGCVVVRDPRVDERDNARFLDLLQAYFAQGAAVNAADVRPELHYQVRRRGGWGG